MFETRRFSHLLRFMKRKSVRESLVLRPTHQCTTKETRGSTTSIFQIFLLFKAGELQRMPRRMKKQFRVVAEQEVETAMYGPIVRLLALPVVYIHIQTVGLKP